MRPLCHGSLGWRVYSAWLCLPQELDFEHEAGNSRRCQANLTSKRSHVKGQVVVPQIEPGMVSKRVLVMEYIEGIKVTDRCAPDQAVMPCSIDARPAVCCT